MLSLYRSIIIVLVSLTAPSSRALAVPTGALPNHLATEVFVKSTSQPISHSTSFTTTKPPTHSSTHMTFKATSHPSSSSTVTQPTHITTSTSTISSSGTASTSPSTICSAHQVAIGYSNIDDQHSLADPIGHVWDHKCKILADSTGPEDFESNNVCFVAYTNGANVSCIDNGYEYQPINITVVNAHGMTEKYGNCQDVNFDDVCGAGPVDDGQDDGSYYETQVEFCCDRVAHF